MTQSHLRPSNTLWTRKVSHVSNMFCPEALGVARHLNVPRSQALRRWRCPPARHRHPHRHRMKFVMEELAVVLAYRHGDLWKGAATAWCAPVRPSWVPLRGRTGFSRCASCPGGTRACTRAWWRKADVNCTQMVPEIKFVMEELTVVLAYRHGDLRKGAAEDAAAAQCAPVNAWRQTQQA